MKRVELLEELSANAWPAAVVQVIDGWRLRFNWGVTRRANSVWANRAGDCVPLVDKLRLVEAFYRRRGQPVRYQICPANHPANLDQLLAGRGYSREAATCVQMASLAAVLDQTQPAPAYRVLVTDTFNEEWFAAYAQIEQFSDHDAQMRRDILQRIGPRLGCALLTAGGQPQAVGSAVVERGWAGLFGMATRSRFRRRGAATAVLLALAEWSRGHQAAQLYLQVMEDNAPAQALYARLGFETLYRYHYRQAPPHSSETRAEWL